MTISRSHSNWRESLAHIHLQSACSSALSPILVFLNVQCVGFLYLWCVFLFVLFVSVVCFFVYIVYR